MLLRFLRRSFKHTTAPDVLQVFLRGQWTDLDGPAQEARIRKTAVAAGQHHE